MPQKRRRRLHGSGLALPSPGRAHGVEAKFARARSTIGSGELVLERLL